MNVQGDEPLIEGFVIDAAVEALIADPEVPMATVVHPAEPGALDDPNRVKVVLDRRGRALYFSRSPIPFRARRRAAAAIWQHVGLYAYRREFLLRFVALGADAGSSAPNRSSSCARSSTAIRSRSRDRGLAQRAGGRAGRRRARRGAPAGAGRC